MWNIEVDRDAYTKLERQERQRDLINNGFETWARFQQGEAGRAAAQKMAAWIERSTGVKMAVYQTYSSNVTV